MILYNFKLLDGISNNVKEGYVLEIKGDKIVNLTLDKSIITKDSIDLKGKYLMPSFIDAHVHIESSMVQPREYSKSLLPHGVLTIIADPHEIVNVGGGPALKAFIEMTKEAYMDIYTVVPSSVPATPYDTNGAGEFLAEDMIEFLKEDRVVGLGEVMCYNDVIQNKKHILDKIKLFNGKTIDGHTAGLDSKYIEDYAKHGISNDHESVDFDDAMVKYNAGLNIYIREGSAARNATSILEGLSNNLKKYKEGDSNRLDINRFAFCTDDKHLSDVDTEGTIDYIFRLAVKLGIDISDVVKMACSNAAKFYKLNNIGSVEIGKKANIVIMDDKSLNIDKVIYAGKIVDNNYINSLNSKNDTIIPSILLNSVTYRDFKADDFDKKIEGQKYAINLVEGQLITTLSEVEYEKESDLNMVATIERYGKNGNYSMCYIKGYNIKNGALAVSVSHDSHNVVCIGDNTKDMAIAINHLKAIGGGATIVSDGLVKEDLVLDIGGLMSSQPGSVVKEKIHKITKIAYSMNVNKNIDPIITLSFVALPVIPFVRLLDTGLYDVINCKFL